MPTPPVRGRFVWHELMTTDPQSALKFFTKVVGWKTQSWDRDPSYTMLTAKGSPMAGVMAIPEDARKMGMPPSWTIYVSTSDLEGTARQAVSLGGKVLKEATEIPTIGRFAVIQDPQGAVFSIFTPLQDGTPPQTPSVGDFSWHELITTDWRAALTFYRALFGWEETSSMDMGPELGTYQMYGWKDQMLGGMFNKPKQQPGPPMWLPYIKVTDAKKAAETVKKLGGQIINGPMEVPGGSWIAQGLDLEGAMFAVHSAKPAAKAPAKKAKRAAPKAARKTAAKKSAKKTSPKKAARKGSKKTARKAATRRSVKKKSASRRRR